MFSPGLTKETGLEMLDKKGISAEYYVLLFAPRRARRGATQQNGDVFLRDPCITFRPASLQSAHAHKLERASLVNPCPPTLCPITSVLLRYL